MLPILAFSAASLFGQLGFLDSGNGDFVPVDESLQFNDFAAVSAHATFHQS